MTENAERIRKALDLLQEGLLPFVERELAAKYGRYWAVEVTRSWNPNDVRWLNDDQLHWDTASLLRVIGEQWEEVFGKILGRSERSYINELREHRNRWAHQMPMGNEETRRMLDTAKLLLRAISAPQADEMELMERELVRIIYEEDERSGQRRKAVGVETLRVEGLPPWTKVVRPHPDVASGRYQKAEFAADIWQVHLGEGSSEYANAEEFFRRTYLTESLKQLLMEAMWRLNGKGGSAVVGLQTTFGGGKTHSMLTLYHLASGIDPKRLAGVEAIMQRAGVTSIPKTQRVVIVGNKISPGNPTKKADGTEIRTLWGELAWQLGGRAAYEQIRLDDERATNPGDRLRELLVAYGPCMILIDEWVAYARQLHEHGDLPGGSFETQFSFAQTLTESARSVPNCLLVVSLPDTQTSSSGPGGRDDGEVGGIRGREALHRLQNIVGRLETSWRPATAEEGFAIVRQRLFESLDPEGHKARDLVARAFVRFYAQNKADFPSGCSEPDYEERIKAAYPIHPEVFDRLYNDWSTLPRFQRTRGVLRLLASVIHRLWESGNESPLILPAHLPMDEERVRSELTRYLEEPWMPVLEKDVDGSSSLPARLDQEKTSFGKYAAARRVARTIYLATAPLQSAANMGIDDRQVKLGCALPGETPSIFGDALRELSTRATYLYSDGARYWYSTQPTVRKLAEDRAERLKREKDQRVMLHIADLMRKDRERTRKSLEKPEIIIFPRDTQEVSDEKAFRLVVFSPDYPYARSVPGGSKAEQVAEHFLGYRGSNVRQFRNTLAFLAPDERAVPDLEDAVRWYLAWESIRDDKELDLKESQRKQAERETNEARQALDVRLRETYIWILAPDQQKSGDPMQWKVYQLSGMTDEGVTMRAIRKLEQEEVLLRGIGDTILRRQMDSVPLWQGDHVPIWQLIEYFFRYYYLQKLIDVSVLTKAIRDGIRREKWEETFAYAEDYDEESGKYINLAVKKNVERIPTTEEEGRALLVKPEVARRQLEEEWARTFKPSAEGMDEHDDILLSGQQEAKRTSLQPEEPRLPPKPLRRQPVRFSGHVRLNANQLESEVNRVREEVIRHLEEAAKRAGGDITLELSITANFPNGGAPESAVRTVEENCRALSFAKAEFREF